MAKSRKALAEEAAKARCDLNIFYGVIALLEGGAVSSGSSGTASKIIRMCKDEGLKCVRRYDSALASLEVAP